jgi:hypothetical protein
MVRGKLAATPEGSIFYDKGCSRGELNLRLIHNDYNDWFSNRMLRKARKPPTATQVLAAYEGTFKIDRSSLHCENNFCSEYILDGARLVDARPLNS